MKDDQAPLSAYRNIDDSQHDHDSAEDPSRPRFWNALLSGIRKSQKPLMRIRMVGSGETRAVVSDRPDLQPAPSAPPVPLATAAIVDQPSLASRIRTTTQQTLDQVFPQVEQLEGLPPPTNPQPEPESESDANPQNQRESIAILTRFAGLSETLLQALLKLDGFEIDVEWTEARAARKEGVRAVQSLLGMSFGT